MSVFKNTGVWSCGFDFLADGSLTATGVFDVVSGGSVGAAYAQYSLGKGMQFTQGQYVGLTLGVNLASLIGGVAFLPITLPGGVTVLATVYDNTAGSGQFVIGYNASGQIAAYQYSGSALGTAGSIIGTASPVGTIVAGLYYQMEFSTTIANSGGSIVININGTQVYSFSGDTQATANTFANRVYIGSASGSGVTVNVDNCYLLDLTATAPLNTFLGPGRLQTDGPTSDSATPGLNAWSFTSPQGTDWGNAANIPPNTAQYNSSATVAQRMSFRFPSLAVARCLFLNTWFSAEEDAAGSRAVTPIYRSGTFDQPGTQVSLSNGSYAYANQPSVTDPATGVPWGDEIPSTAANAEIGLQVSA